MASLVNGRGRHRRSGSDSKKWKEMVDLRNQKIDQEICQAQNEFLDAIIPQIQKSYRIIGQKTYFESELLTILDKQVLSDDDILSKLNSMVSNGKICRKSQSPVAEWDDNTRVIYETIKKAYLEYDKKVEQIYADLHEEVEKGKDNESHGRRSRSCSRNMSSPSRDSSYAERVSPPPPSTPDSGRPYFY